MIGKSVRAALAMVLCCAGVATAQGTDDSLAALFKAPPESAKPRVWWHWMNGNVSQPGITADLEWMHRVGIGGMQNFDADLGTPVVVPKRVVWGTDDWKAAVRHAAAEADRLGLEMSMMSAGGWSEAGGPWVKPEEAMKYYVWSETAVTGPKDFNEALPHPPNANAVFEGGPPPAKDSTPGYGDSRVIAFRVPDGERSMADAQPAFTSSLGAINDPSVLMDGNTRTDVSFDVPQGTDEAWFQVTFPEPYRAHAVTIAGYLGDAYLQSSQDGQAWTNLASLDRPVASKSTFAFPTTTARYYRILVQHPREKIGFSEFELSSVPLVTGWEGKIQHDGAFVSEYHTYETPEVGKDEAIAPDNVVDLTSKMSLDGTLNWSVPDGHWVILRIGYAPTGHTNGPASPEATGLEVDKLNRTFVERYMDHYLGLLHDAAGPYLGKSFKYLLMDSWEAGTENWTTDFIEQFKAHRGYDPTPYLPVLTGRVVLSADASDRFLWDYRRTLADLVAENYYGVTAEMLKKYHMGLYAEAMGINLPTTGDGLLNKGQVTIPMGEFWENAPRMPGEDLQQIGDTREAASAAHIYGKGLAATETLTGGSGWEQHPWEMKEYLDWGIAQGINRFVIHTSVHQPFVDGHHKPGMTLGPFGEHYTRNNTWAEQSVGFNNYMARSSLLMQQGLFVGDLLYFYGENAPITVPFWKGINPQPPHGYNYDWLNADVLLNRLSVQDGRLVLPDGMSYKVLVIPAEITQMTLPVIKKIRDLVAAGATVISPRPTQSPSLTGYPASDDSVHSIATEVWGDIDGIRTTDHAYGKGHVYWGKTVQEVMTEVNTPPDFLYNHPAVDDSIVWIHRRSGTADIYFVANQRDRAVDFTTEFRVSGREAELWDAVSGTIVPASYSFDSVYTTVPIHLGPFGSTFVVFRNQTTTNSRVLPKVIETPLTTLQGPWTITFPPDWGAPASTQMDSLASWTTSSDDGVKYFSGTATYSKDVDVTDDWVQPGNRVILDLGDVKEVSEITVNGQYFGVQWSAPYRADITSALKAGSNHIEIKVTNLWENRRIGDAQPGAPKKYTFDVIGGADKNEPLLPSGLLGPVRLYKDTTEGQP